MPALGSVTLCCIDTAQHLLSAMALRTCLVGASFAKTVFLTDRADYVRPDWEFHRINTFENFTDVNNFRIKSLYHHINTEHVLMIEHDGFILNPDNWSDEFLAYDYIGAPMPWMAPGYVVGAGGFSLRSKRLLRALQDDRIALHPTAMSEDRCICNTYRSYLELHHGIRFAPIELAAKFSFDSGMNLSGTFGFHGLMWMADLYRDEAAMILADNIHSYALKTHKAVVLATRLNFVGSTDAAERLFQRIGEHDTLDNILRRYRDQRLSELEAEYVVECWTRYVSRPAADVLKAQQAVGAQREAVDAA